MSRFTNRVVLVTGAGSGIGQAAARVFAGEGASVGVLDARLDSAAETVDLIESAGGKAIALKADVTCAAEVEAAVDGVVTRFGGVHVLFNNAGCDSQGSVAEATEDDWDRAFAVNAKGTFLCSRAVVPHMRRAGFGAIVNQASVAALVGVPNVAAYCAAKGAVVALTRSMAIDLAPDIRVNAVCPGTVMTALIEPLIRARGDGDLDLGLAKTVTKYPVGRLGTVDEAARVAVFLASEDAAFMTGSIVTADGGMTAQ